jgi:hypothetical protein
VKGIIALLFCFEKVFRRIRHMGCTDDDPIHNDAERTEIQRCEFGQGGKEGLKIQRGTIILQMLLNRDRRLAMKGVHHDPYGSS